MYLLFQNDTIKRVLLENGPAKAIFHVTEFNKMFPEVSIFN